MVLTARVNLKDLLGSMRDLFAIKTLRTAQLVFPRL